MRLLNMFASLNKRLSITKKVILLYVFLILIPACSMMYNYYVKTTGIIENEVTNSILQALKQAEINISYRLNNIRVISNSVFMNSKLFDFLSTDNNDVAKQISDAKELGNIITSAETNTDILKVRLFVDRNKIYSGEHINFFSLDEIMDKSWYKNITEQNGSVYWIGTYKESYIDHDEEFVISCARILKNPQNYDLQVGALIIDMPEKNLYKILSGINTSYEDNIVILDDVGKVISHVDKSKIGTTIFNESDFIKIQKDNEGVFSIGKGDEMTFIIHKTMEITGWSIVASIPAKAISEKNAAFSKASNVISIIGILIAFMLAFFLVFALLAESINRRIKHLVSILKKEGIKSLDDSLSIKDEDFTLLENSMNEMLQTMHNLIEESYHSKIHEREAQLKALQAQINPHFLYNTLDTINWMAIKINAEDISSMVDSLAKYFRLSLNKGRDIVSINDEVNLARAYLEIQKMRFINCLEVEINVEEEIMNYSIPKLVLQPIVENALLHGIQKKKDRKGTIKINAEKTGESIIITVKDDGIGIDTDKIEKIFLIPGDGSLDVTTGSSYGLRNVNERIKLFSGEEYGIKINSLPGKGTTVEIIINAITQ